MFALFGVRCKVAHSESKLTSLLKPALGPPEPLGPDSLCTLTVLVIFSLKGSRSSAMAAQAKAQEAAPVLNLSKSRAIMA